ncbi:hypothetical protein XNC1_2570 [Xenorhabdus nematophila ATCC 19061]|uniref:Uncharacterized protein n=1 Tax=Xenorhabdus nematophila (strain ATCC 19061 / DSM 3370 / CCUG 14189 / LMG 1036 / NCIMB 9965 / AN6) TaxID=406817 RepID=D3VHI3_XENNA|nr:hypothetical protein XNC1_2570 [Xenorhabdus nematophila ATCC 19061]
MNMWICAQSWIQVCIPFGTLLYFKADEEDANMTQYRLRL